jgi:hypothetical protein
MTSTFRTALLIPSITRRIDNFLLVKELNARFFDHQISEVLLDMAISAPSARLEYDYERLELLGEFIHILLQFHQSYTSFRRFFPQIFVVNLRVRE